MNNSVFGFGFGLEIRVFFSLNLEKDMYIRDSIDLIRDYIFSSNDMILNLLFPFFMSEIDHVILDWKPNLTYFLSY